MSTGMSAMREQKPMKSATDVARIAIKHMEAAGRPIAVWINRDEIVSLSAGILDAATE